MPVHLETMRAMSSSSTSSFNMREPRLYPSALLSRSSSACILRQFAVLDLRSAVVIARARGILLLLLDCSIFSFSSRMRLMLAFSCSQRARRALICSFSSASCFSNFGQAFARVRIFLALQRLPLDFELRSAALSWSISVGTEPICMRSEAAASSIRSIALSGRKRSVM